MQVGKMNDNPKDAHNEREPDRVKKSDRKKASMRNGGQRGCRCFMKQQEFIEQNDFAYLFNYSGLRKAVNGKLTLLNWPHNFLNLICCPSYALQSSPLLFFSSFCSPFLLLCRSLHLSALPVYVYVTVNLLFHFVLPLSYIQGLPIPLRLLLM